jgi:hypothetical protein
VTGSWRRLHSEELHDVYSFSSCFIEVADEVDFCSLQFFFF